MLDFPAHVEFELTNCCNAKCVMCPHRIMSRQKGYMDFGLYKRAIDQCRGKVNFSYLHQIGEPLLHPEHTDFIDYADEAGITTSISTNCMLLNKRRAKNLVSSKLKEITLCVDSLNQDNYSKIRPGGDLNVVLDNIDYFLSINRNIKVDIQMIKMLENTDERELFKQRFGDLAFLKEYSTFGGAVKKGEDVPSRRTSCNKMNTHMTVQWNGDVTPCCRDYDGISVFGNINDDTMQDIWNNAMYQAFRKNWRTTELCRDC